MSLRILTAVHIASICHEANRQLTRIVGDVPVQPSWEESPMEMRNSCVKGVEFNIDNPEAPPSASHENWLKERRAQGWTLGPVKDTALKQHPALVPYDELPDPVKLKDALFKSIVNGLGR